MSEERLQKILARAGVASRRKVEELIRDGRVTLNGRLAEIGDKADLERDAVKVDGRRVLPPRGNRYLLLYKPRAVMSTVSDPEGRPTVIDLIPPALRKALVPVGRLDYHTEGMLLLTDDGEFAQQVAHPRYGCVKTYEVKVKGHPEERDLDRLRSGIPIEGRRTAPARIRPRPAVGRHFESDNSWWIVELSEGRSRQIREMFQAIGNPVQKLRRVAIGPVSDPTMGPGDLRELTTREVEQLRRKSVPSPERKGGENERPRGAAKRARPRAGGKPVPGERRRGETASTGRGREGTAPGGGRAGGTRDAKGTGRGAAEPRPAGRPRGGPGPGGAAGRPGSGGTGAVRKRGGSTGTARPGGAGSRGGARAGGPGGGRPGGGRSSGAGPKGGAGSGKPGGSRSGSGRPGGGRPGAGRSSGHRGRS